MCDERQRKARGCGTGLVPRFVSFEASSVDLALAFCRSLADKTRHPLRLVNKPKVWINDKVGEISMILKRFMECRKRCTVETLVHQLSPFTHAWMSELLSCDKNHGGHTLKLDCCTGSFRSARNHCVGDLHSGLSVRTGGTMACCATALAV